MENDFKVGDVVVLKSGSPEMTINFADKNATVECICFVDFKPTHSQFHYNTLKKVS